MQHGADCVGGRKSCRKGTHGHKGAGIRCSRKTGDSGYDTGEKIVCRGSNSGRLQRQLSRGRIEVSICPSSLRPRWITQRVSVLTIRPCRGEGTRKSTPSLAQLPCARVDGERTSTKTTGLLHSTVSSGGRDSRCLDVPGAYTVDSSMRAAIPFGSAAHGSDIWAMEPSNDLKILRLNCAGPMRSGAIAITSPLASSYRCTSGCAIARALHRSTAIRASPGVCMVFSGIAKVVHWSSHVFDNRQDASHATWLTKKSEFNGPSNTRHIATANSHGTGLPTFGRIGREGRQIPSTWDRTGFGWNH